ncbi:MAG TPA: GNAT family N-acetyltransferase [Solirubrobacteraceae bacterium]|nr:GNAT family N-acetyltransferase [Solirubrobacteraceae bacterium]
MDVELVGPEDLDEALGDWARLETTDPSLTPFNSSAWGRVWLEHWDVHAEPWILRVRRDDQVVGLAPLALQRRRGVRVLSMIGKEPGDYWDLIAPPSERAAVARAVGAELRRRSRAWDIAVISCLPAGSATLSGLTDGGLRLFRRPPVRSPAIQLPSSFEDYLRTLSGSRRGNLRRHLNRLDRGELSVREVSQPDQIPGVLSRWHELRIRQWRETGRELNPSHAEEHFLRFMVQAAIALLEPGFTSLSEVFAGERLAGVYLNFCDDRAFYWYLGGYEPDLGALGVGKIVIAATIRASIAAGRQWYDFTRGQDEYKYWYGARDRLLDSVVLAHDGARSRLALTAAQGVSRYRGRKSGA